MENTSLLKHSDPSPIPQTFEEFCVFYLNWRHDQSPQLLYGPGVCCTGQEFSVSLCELHELVSSTTLYFAQGEMRKKGVLRSN